MPEVNVDPRIKIKVVPDGEVHIVFSWTEDDLKTFAEAWLKMQEPGNKNREAGAVFRLRNRDAVDYLITELQKAKKKLWGG